jgi:hypothetical protein
VDDDNDEMHLGFFRALQVKHILVRGWVGAASRPKCCNGTADPRPNNGWNGTQPLAAQCCE